MIRLFLILSFLFLVNFSVFAECVLKMGVFPYSNPQKLVTDYSPIAEKISKDIDCKVKIYTATNYEEYMSKATNLEYDIFIPCVSCIVKLLTNKALLEVIATGYPSFKGAVIVRHDSKIDSLNKIKGIKIAAVGEHSFGGYLFLKYKLQSKMTPFVKTFFHRF